ncbi:MAG: 4-(cytidine 5'-diphospho)-2-C-methyl-D-erythritol kinase [Pedosphaera sp.]|nr:4-(cytidine 5'-diphospho)-2-C-methyl-D-erythritol kinase [Pedosphaera sp.]
MPCLSRSSPCKINLVLNILGRRADGFHELETLLLPVPLCDKLTFDRHPSGIHLTCSHPDLPVDESNLVHRAARGFLDLAGIREGIAIHLDKQIPLAAGLGGGSGNAAHTLLGLNEVFGHPLSGSQLDTLAAGLGSDVNFFLQTSPAIAAGRGEKITPIPEFQVLKHCFLFLFHPGFGISTAWAYQQLARYPEALHGKPGRAAAAANALSSGDLAAVGSVLYNSLEAPALEKYPVLPLYQNHLRENGSFASRMSGSGSTTFALFGDESTARNAAASFRSRFGDAGWAQVVPLCRDTC